MAYLKPHRQNHDNTVNEGASSSRSSSSSSHSKESPSSSDILPNKLRPVVRARVECQEEISSEDDSGEEYRPPREPKQKKVSVEDSEEVFSAIDRTHSSTRSSAHIICSTLRAVGSSASISKSTVHRKRTIMRTEIGNKIRNEFSPEGPLTVHFDSKIMDDLDGESKCDRFPIFITGPENEEQILASPKLESGSGESQARAVYDTLNPWNLSEKVKAMSGDTTNSVSGWVKGAVQRLEKLLGHDLLYFACRKHVAETLLEGVATVCTGASQSPEVKLFKRFHDSWNKIDTRTYSDGPSDESVWELIETSTERVLKFAKDQLEVHQPRADYKELLELLVIFAGDQPRPNFHFVKPGALSRARWMMHLIYGLKTWMFREQFPLTQEEEIGLRNLCVFGFNTYAEFWYQATTSAASAPRFDLQLYRHMSSQAQVGTLAKEYNAAVVKLRGHFWYLSERLITLALFDQDVPDEEKREMVRRLTAAAPRKKAIGRWRWKRNPADVDINTRLCDLVTPKSMDFFTILDLDSSFLAEDPSKWATDPKYQAALRLVKSFQVTNEVAERGVALTKSMLGLVKNEENFQNLLLVTHRDRQLNKLG